MQFTSAQLVLMLPKVLYSIKAFQPKRCVYFILSHCVTRPGRTITIIASHPSKTNYNTPSSAVASTQLLHSTFRSRYSQNFAQKFLKCAYSPQSKSPGFSPIKPSKLPLICLDNSLIISVFDVPSLNNIPTNQF
jgi:hypothetical protein